MLMPNGKIEARIQARKLQINLVYMENTFIIYAIWEHLLVWIIADIIRIHIFDRATCNLYRSPWHKIGIGALFLDCMHDGRSFHHFAENCAFAVEPRRCNGRDIELAAVCVGATIGHGQEAGSAMIHIQIFVGKCVTIDADGTVAII